jgi:hypothetical protein
MTSSICPRQSPPSLSWSTWHVTRSRRDARHTRRRVARQGSRPRTFQPMSGIRRTHQPAFQNASQTSHGSRLQAVVLSAAPEGTSGRRPASVRPPEDRSAKVNGDTLELRRAPQSHLASLPSPRGAHQQTAETPRRSEELFAVPVALRAPWNPSTNGRLAAGLRRVDWQASRSRQSS